MATRRRRGRPRLEETGQLDRELLGHALDHFLEKGFESTTMSAITRSLGMSKQTVYARYPSKHALFVAAIQSAIDEWLAPFERLHEHESDDLEATLVAVATILVQTMLSPTGMRLIRITNAESCRMPEIGRYTYGKGHETVSRFLADLFRRRLPSAAERDDIDDLATAFLNLMSVPARLQAWGLAEEPVELGQFVRKRVQLFLRGALRH
ncbi:MAG: TetR/AcrR family transcriptional regulator [Novosphingobium sp.]|nr:TetR/AcrR family transcriptional regulator [Novosphingobium sp.]